MRDPESQTVKHRDIVFADLHPDPHQARSASLVLAQVPGVHHLQAISPTFLRISYDVLQITREQIETLLSEKGFHLDNRLVHRLIRGLHYYTEETLRANLGCPRGESNCTQKIFAERYGHTDHGCRDQRPEHWRRYL